MRILWSIALLVVFLAAAKPSFAQVQDPSACASTVNGSSWQYPDRSACLNVVNAIPHHIFGIGDRTLVGHRAVLCDWNGSQDSRYIFTPDWGYHNASENYTHYVVYYSGSDANCDYEPSGGAWDLDTTWAFTPPNWDPFSFNPATGFTIMMKLWIDADEPATASQAKDYATVSASDGSGPVFVLGRKGLQWGLATRATGSGKSLGYFWQFPWDAPAYPGYFQLVFYTFSPQGTVRIDSFHDENDQGTSPSTDFESGLLEFGTPSQGLPSGTPTSNPTGLNFYPLSNQITLGQTLNGDTYGTGLQEITVWTQPLSPGEAAAYADSQHGRYDGTFYPNACNTGYMLNAATPTGGTKKPVPVNRCGYQSNWSRNSASYVLEGSVSPASDTFGSTGETLPITLTNTGTAPLAIASIALGGNDPADFAETNSCPSSLAVNDSCTISVTSQFIKSGDSASLIVTTNGTNSPETVSLNEEEK